MTTKGLVDQILNKPNIRDRTSRRRIINDLEERKKLFEKRGHLQEEITKLDSAIEQLNELDTLSHQKHVLQVENDQIMRDFRGIMRKWGLSLPVETHSDIEILAMLYTDVRHGYAKGHDNDDAVAAKGADGLLYLAKHENLAHRYDWLVRWKASGYARMSCGHKMAAALMMTSAPDDADIPAPWDAWSLYVPEGLLKNEFSKEGLDRAENAIKEHEEKGDLAAPLNFFEIGAPKPGETPISNEIRRIWCDKSEPRYVLVQSENKNCCVMKLSELGHVQKVNKINILVRNYVKGVCIALDRDVQQHRAGIWGPKSGKKRTGKEPATGSQYELGSPIHIDLREAVREYLNGPRRGSSPTIQFLVRGHYRNQAHGVARSERRRIWIEPFWKGDEEARILLRTHFVKATDKDPP